jgi:hypothetical protein
MCFATAIPARAADSADPGLLEFLGSVDSPDKNWREYLARQGRTVPAQPPAAPSTPPSPANNPSPPPVSQPAGPSSPPVPPPQGDRS